MKLRHIDAGTQPVSFLCKPDLKADIETVAAYDGLSLSDVIRRAVQHDVRRRKAEAAADAA